MNMSHQSLNQSINQSHNSSAIGQGLNTSIIGQSLNASGLGNIGTPSNVQGHTAMSISSRSGSPDSDTSGVSTGTEISDAALIDLMVCIKVSYIYCPN